MNHLPHWVAYAANTALWGTLSVGSSLFDRGGRLQHGCMRLWSLSSLRLAGAKVEAQGLHHLKSERPVLIFSNHQGPLDICVLSGHLPVQFRWLAKKSLFRIPFLGWHLHRAGHVPIDRSRHERAIRSIEEAALRVRAGVSVLVFPEGTRSKDRNLLPFKKGVFHLAVQAQVPIVPVAIDGSNRVLPPRSLQITPGTIRLRVGAPFETAGMSLADLPALMERTRSAIQSLLDEIRQDEAAAAQARR